MEPYQSLLDQAKRYALAYMHQIRDMPPYPSKKSLDGLETLEEDLPRSGTEPSAVLELLRAAGENGTTAQTGGRYFGFVNGGLLPVAQAAEWLADTWNQNGALAVMSPVTAKIESVCERWIADLFGLERGTAMGLVTGSSNAIICALAAARNELLNRQGWNISERGFRGAPRIRVVIGAEAHSSVKAGLSILGFGTEEIETVPTDELGRIEIGSVPKLDRRTLLILQAGNVNGGSFDPICALCELAETAGAWVHIDGAFGLWAAASKKHRMLTKGIEKADSWSADAHKTLNAGYDCGIVLCRHREALVAALQAAGSYIQYGEQRDGMLYTTEMSRRARGIPLWAALKTLGADGVEKLVDTLCENAEYFAKKLRESGYILVNPVIFNQFMVAGRTDTETENILRAVQSSGVCWCSGSRWKGKSVIRISVCSHATTREDIDRSAELFKKIRDELYP